MIAVTTRDAIATITLMDCTPLSLHDPKLGLALRDAVRDAADSDDVKAIVIRAGGANFCPPVAQTKQPDDEWLDIYAAASGLYQNLCFCKKVVITAVQGQCAGAGSLLVLCADLTVAAHDATFASPFDSLPEANLVLAALTLRLNRAKSWMLGGFELSAQQASDAGLINRIVEPGALDAAAQKMARAVTRMPLDGIAMSKINVEASLDAQGVGREFDMAGFYAESLRRAHDEAAS
jgi:enoyl-CoA hydratase/carnithine racemase